MTRRRIAASRIGSLYALTATSMIVGCGAVAAVASTLTPPAVVIADRYLTLTAILAGAAIVTAAATAPRPLERPERLVVVVAILAAAGSWYWARTWVHEKQFDYLVERQTRDLELAATELSGDIVNFLRERAAEAPPRPAAATWDRDVAANLSFDSETSVLFEQRFGGQVRRTRDLFALEGLTDRDLDVFYRRPANAFQIDVVAKKLDALARRLMRRAT